jgi:hypothetical protein
MSNIGFKHGWISSTIRNLIIWVKPTLQWVVKIGLKNQTSNILDSERGMFVYASSLERFVGIISFQNNNELWATFLGWCMCDTDLVWVLKRRSAIWDFGFAWVGRMRLDRDRVMPAYPRWSWLPLFVASRVLRGRGGVLVPCLYQTSWISVSFFNNIKTKEKPLQAAA